MINNLMSLIKEVQQSNQIVSSELNSISGTFSLWIQDQFCPTPPDWAMNHVKITQLLERSIQELKFTPHGIPQEAFDALKEGKWGIKQLGLQIDLAKILKCSESEPALPFLANQPALHQLQSQGPHLELASCLNEWHLHLGLIMSVYQRTKDEKLKEQIRFLALNYLYKAAPISPNDIAISRETIDILFEKMQLGIWNPGISYNRESDIFDAFFTKEIRSVLSTNCGESFVIVDSLDIDSILNLDFSFVKIKSLNDLTDYC